MVECIYRPVRQSQKKQKRLKRDSLVERLLRTEAALKSQGVNLDTISETVVSQSDRPHEADKTSMDHGVYVLPLLFLLDSNRAV